MRIECAKFAVGLVLATVAPVAVCQPQPAPALPFVDFKACPFEGCTYTRWVINKRSALYDTWKENRRVVAQLIPGEAVEAMTGLVITHKPGVIRMDRDLPEQGLKQGETILTYTYRGEGVSAVWFHGKYEADYDISFTKWPDGGGCGGNHCAARYLDLGNKVWWAEVTTRSGHTGWIEVEKASINFP